MNPVQKSFEKRVKGEEGLFGNVYGKRLSFLISYPNYYNIGMANLGFQSIYYTLLRDERILVDRAFLPYPDEEDYLKRTNTPLFSYTTYMSLQDFDIVAFSISFEPDYLNFIKMLDLSGIPLYAKDRGKESPLIIVGGVAPSANPLPIKPFADIFVIGEGEEIIHDIIDLVIHEKERESILRILSKWRGIYVPKYPVHRVERLWVKDVDKYPSESVLYSKEQEFPDMHLIEIGRGCGRGCRFCMAGYIYRPVRNRGYDVIMESAKRGSRYRKKVGLVSPSVSDHPEILDILRGILDMELGIGISSLRSDSATRELFGLLKKGGLRTITLAPEVGTDKMREVINKNIYPDLLFEKIGDAISEGIKSVKLYFLVGLPEETDDDIEGIVGLIEDLLSQFKSLRELIISINPFIPKPHTPFEVFPQEREDVVNRRLLYIENTLRKRYNRIKILPREIKYYVLQGLLSRGGEEIAPFLPEIARKGPRRFKKIVPYELIEKTIFSPLKEEDLPWRIIDTMVSPSYLARERKLMKKRRFTPPCPPQGCTMCGVCQERGGIYERFG